MNFIVQLGFHNADANDVAYLVDAADAQAAENRVFEYHQEDGPSWVEAHPASPAEEERFQGLAL